jgi:hypothetical protein
MFSTLVAPPDDMELPAHYVILKGLRPATVYKYRITTLDGNSSQEVVSHPAPLQMKIRSIIRRHLILKLRRNASLPQTLRSLSSQTKVCLSGLVRPVVSPQRRHMGNGGAVHDLSGSFH